MPLTDSFVLEPSQDQETVENRSTSHPDIAANTFPEGGLRAWMSVLGGFMIMVCTLAFGSSFGVYQDYYTRISLDEHATSQISWIGSLQTFLLFGSGIYTGRLYDKGYFWHLMGAGSILYWISLFMLSLAQPHHYYQNFLSQGLGLGLAMGMLFVPGLSVVSQYFQARRSTAMGGVLAGSGVGGVIWPIILNHMFNTSAGFGWAVRTSGFITVVLLSLASILIKPRLPPRAPTQQPNMLYILRDTSYSICLAGSVIIYLGIFFPFFYLQLFSSFHGVSPKLDPYTIPILNGAALFGRTVPNIFADRYGTLNVFMGCSIITGVVIISMLGATSSGGVITFAILYGFFSGGAISLTAPVFASFANTDEEIGTRIGIGTFSFSFALLCGNPISGALLDSPRYFWTRPILFNAVRT
ncbi:MFS general substrate transporter [Dendrothele bispora CBS 962.96]|uniref:MFS general substrate transporter n=1 Tax=Dendrothele bispora (strain CBS 962.96) TaxID=1314807 RepID=A0A4S8KQS7_DENBC|nr:MFS general substrate transporter [Dendrothele bispora CBS 962.96]